MMEQDVRWKQRFSNFEKALIKLKQAVTTLPSPSELEKEGIIQRFEFTHELAWKVMKDYLEYEGYKNITGSRSATREAFNKGLINNGQVWMDMVESRNKTVHTYQDEILTEEYNKIVRAYFYLLIDFFDKMKTLL